MSDFLTITQTNQTGYINNIHVGNPGGINLQDNSNNILTISSVGDVNCKSLTTTANVNCNSLNTTQLYIGGNSTIFRFVPWTITYGNNPTGSSYINNSQLPVASYNNNIQNLLQLNPASGSTWAYSYSIIGNTMYVNYQYNGTTANSAAGNGLYVYLLPTTNNFSTTPPYVIDTTILYANYYYGQSNADFGSKVGSCNLVYYGNSSASGPVRITTLTPFSKTYLYLMDYNTFQNQNSNHYGYNTTNLNVTFEASFPIKPG